MQKSKFPRNFWNEVFASLKTRACIITLIITKPCIKVKLLWLGSLLLEAAILLRFLMLMVSAPQKKTLLVLVLCRQTNA